MSYGHLHMKILSWTEAELIDQGTMQETKFAASSLKITIKSYGY